MSDLALSEMVVYLVPVMSGSRIAVRPALCLRIPINRVDEVEGAGLKIRDGRTLEWVGIDPDVAQEGPVSPLFAYRQRRMLLAPCCGISQRSGACFQQKTGVDGDNILDPADRLASVIRSGPVPRFPPRSAHRDKAADRRGCHENSRAARSRSATAPGWTNRRRRDRRR